VPATACYGATPAGRSGPGVPAGELISVAQFTDVNNWYLVCDPAQVESIEIGFVGVREVPVLLQDAPLSGLVFTNHRISYKVRWEFGGGWLDYRGAHWGAHWSEVA
jgi:hypothetical protein